MRSLVKELEREIEEEKARLSEGQLMYHSTDPKNVGSIQQDGLTVGRESAHTLGGAWADEFYGTRPIYLSVEKGKYTGTPLAVDTSGLALVADLPSLVDAGAYQEEKEGMYWDEGSEPAQMIDIVDEDGMVYFDDLLSPGSAAAEAAIEITGTAAVLDNIPPQRIQLTERRHMKITKNQLRRIIKEERERMLNEGMGEVLKGAKAFGRSLGGRPDLAMKIGAALTASDIPQEIVVAITNAYEDAQADVDKHEHHMDPPSVGRYAGLDSFEIFLAKEEEKRRNQ